MIFGEILDCIAEALQVDDANLKRIHIDVVCDRKLYRSHSRDDRFRVHLYQQSELFHPKLLIVLLADRVVWISGSANSTRAGYCANREIMLLHEPGDPTLPAPLRRLLARLSSEAARLIRKKTLDGPPASIQNGRENEVE
jgi:hypothetical protein